MNVSVIIPCHNLGEFIDECVGSVVAQDVPDSEIIVVDDGSTDPGTLDKLSRLPVKYRNLRVIRTEHRNVSLARNTGYTHSSGRFILFLDSDDMIGEKFLDATMSMLEAKPEYGVAYTDIQLFGLETGTWVTGPALSPHEIYFDNYLQYCSLIRRSVIDMYGGFDPDFPLAEDWEFWIKLHKNGVRFLKVPGVWARYRKRRNSKLAVNKPGLPCQINRVIVNHKDVYSQFFFRNIGTSEEQNVRALIQTAAEGSHGEPIAKLRRTRVYRLFICYSVVIRAYRKVWTRVMRGKT